jgi:hypothetical protein
MHGRGERERTQPLAHEQREVRGIARRRHEPDVDAGGGAALMQERQGETLNAAVARRQETRQLIDEAPRREQQRFAVRDRRRELEPRAKLRGRDKELARRRQPSQRAVDGIEQWPAAAPREPVARQRHEFGHVLDADRLQRLRRLRIAVEGGKRQARDDRFERALAVDDFLHAGAGEQ